MARYLFTISGHVEVVANSVEEAVDKVFISPYNPKSLRSYTVGGGDEPFLIATANNRVPFHVVKEEL